MTDIRVERKGRLGRLGWILVGMAIALVFTVLAVRWNEKTVPVGRTVAPPQVPVNQYEQRIRTPMEITAAADNAALAGRPVELDQQNIQATISDRAFWIGKTWADRVLVVPEDRSALPDFVQPGNSVSVIGEMERVPDTKELREEWNLDRSSSFPNA